MTYGFFWIGLHERGGKWVWDDGSHLGYTNWAEGNNKARQCAVMKVADGTWVTADCLKGYQAMCSGPAMKDVTTITPKVEMRAVLIRYETKLSEAARSLFFYKEECFIWTIREGEKERKGCGEIFVDFRYEGRSDERFQHSSPPSQLR
ncbi:hypothetical protein ANCCAN_01189 [Ancylostoma caninum]|uniref:C-type lectin domain-containing protein n=1 Tax=Ancylostoma caninum TaxID=29170 RepID=A0A368H8A1_ANCCA|nr:hypothetical protein ANCCAN_01189 [Ancylostoma caninum]